MRFFFTKSDRILKRPDFLRLQRTGTRLQNDHFIASYSLGRCDRSRLGITVTRKVGNAVARNRIKRLSREFFRLNRHKMADCVDIVIIAKKEAAGLTFDRAASSLEDIFGRISKTTE